ncbi:MAG TPA: potassium/proton antiporter [Aquihabitans sp.]|nr:potassium/proton antiporter [Aquihabitans sp.]
MEASLPIDGVILAVAALLALGLLGTTVVRRTPVPSLLVSLAIGMALGSDGLGWVDVGFADLDWVQGASIAALVLVLFSGGLSTPTAAVREAGPAAALMATAGVGLTMGVVALVARPLLDVELETALLLGAVVASTDAAAIFSALRDAPIPGRVRSLLEVESGFNDPTAVLLTVGVLEATRRSPSADEWLAFGLRQLGGGALVGVAVGVAAAVVLQRARFHSSATAAVAALTAGGLAFGLATLVGGSGLLATYVAGVVIGGRVTRHLRLVRGLHASLGEAAEIGLFLLLGLLVFPSQLPEQAGRGLLIAVVLTFVARPFAVGVLLPWFGYRPRELTLIAWAGLRGAVPIVLATFPLIDGHPAGLTIFNVVFFVVVLSTAAQAMTVAPLARRLGLAAEPEPWRAVVETVPVDRLGGELVELDLGPASPVAGRLLREVPLPARCRVTALIRGDDVVVPDGDTRLADHDHLLVLAPDAGAGTEALRRWAGERPARRVPGSSPTTATPPAPEA